MRLSIVSTLYRSAAYLPEFYRRATAAAEQLLGPGEPYEIVFVNDGSPDDSLAVALALQRSDPRVRIIDLSRNFGHHQAMWTGLQHARGDDVFLIDCDLQEAPEWLGEFAQLRKTTGADVVYGVQDTRDGTWTERWGGWVFYRLFNAFCDEPLPENLMTVRLMSRRYIDALLQHPEVTLVISGLWARTGFLQVPARVRKAGRSGRTTYSVLRRARLFLHALISYSNKPLVFIFYLGLAISLISGLFATHLVVQRLFFSDMLFGWPSLMVSIWFLGGLIIFAQGVQGLYLAKLFLEAKRRPVAIIRHIHESEAPFEEGPMGDRLRIAQ